VTLSANTNWYIPCPTFTVKTNPLVIGGGATVVFNGAVSVEAGGTLATNVADVAAPAVDSSGYLVPESSARQTTIVLRSTGGASMAMQSTSSKMFLAQTAIYSKGGFSLQGSPQLKWTPPTTGAATGLIWWSESSQPVSLSGSPGIAAKGVFFHGNGAATISGGGSIDLTKVQMWMDSVSISGGGLLRLSADPENSIPTDGAGSFLVR
jgi:hypothetical protein